MIDFEQGVRCESVKVEFHAGKLDFSATSNGMGCHINNRLSDNH